MDNGMKQYHVKMTGVTPLLMHADDLMQMEKIDAWRKDPANKQLSVKGDDRSPAFTWIAYVYSDRRHLGIPSDNIMTMFREAGAKVPTGKGSETYKKQTQAGIMLDQPQWQIFNGEGKPVPWKPIAEMWGENDFVKHIELAESLGFELNVKRAKIGQSKHVRVRPMFRDWTAEGSFTVIDEEQTGLTRPIIETIMAQAGTLVGVCDWRPSSPRSSGTFGKFTVEIS